MQFMPGTAAAMAHKLWLDPTACSPATPHLNIRMGIDRIPFMLGSYNAGPGNILEAQDLAGCSGLATNRWMSIDSSLPEITGRDAPETISYVQRIESLFGELTRESKS